MHTPARNPVALITVTVMLGLTMAIMDSTVVNVALDTIGGNLGASIDDVSWIATGYMLASVITMPLNGWLTALFGRKIFYAGSLALFTVASFLCGSAHDVWQLTFYRVIQGFGGGALQPTAQAILLETYPPSKRGLAMALYGLGIMVGPVIGPVIGGYIIDNASWPLIFLINIPIGIVAFLMTLAFIPNPSYHERPKGGVDWIGLGLLSTGLATLQYVLERGQHDDWWSSDTIATCAAISGVALLLFVAKMRRDSHPLVDLGVFRFQSFSVGNLFNMIVGFEIYGTSLIIPLFLQTMLGMTAFDTGLALMPGAIATAAALFIVGRLEGKIDSRLIMGAGAALFAWSCWSLGGLNQQAGYWDVFYPRLVQGFGFGCVFVPLYGVILAPVPKRELAGATGVTSLLRQIGGSLGIAIITTLLQRRTDYAWAMIAPTVIHTHGYSIQMLVRMVAHASTIIAYLYLFRVCAILFVLGLPLIVLMRTVKHAREQHAAAPSEA